MPYTRLMAKGARMAAQGSPARALEQKFPAVSPLLAPPRELRYMILEHAILDSSVHIRKGKTTTLHIISPFTGVCHQIEAELQRLLQNYTQILWRQAREVTVDVYNLDFDPLVAFLDSLTQQDMAELRQHRTKITSRLRFGRCSRKFRSRRQIKEEDMASLVDWLKWSTDPNERWSSLSDWSCSFVIKHPDTTVIPWLRALRRFIVDLYWSPSGAMTRPGTLGLRRQVDVILNSGVDAL